MTNDEAVQWCIDTNAKVHFLSGCVQVYVTLGTPTPSSLPYNAVLCKETFLEAVEATKAAYDDVKAGILSPADPSLAKPNLPRPLPEPVELPEPTS